MPPALLIIGLAINVSAWYMIIGSWYSPRGRNITAGIHAVLRWSPMPSWFTVLLIALLPLVFGVLSLVAVFGETRSLKPADAVDNGRHLAAPSAV